MQHCSKGPVSTMPNSSCGTDADDMCDDHEDRKAVRRVQGETDSFGCEYMYMCQECLDKYKAGLQDARSGFCDWCKNDVNDLSPRRDFDEGRHGRVYSVCGECRKQDDERIEDDCGSNYESGYEAY